MILSAHTCGQSWAIYDQPPCLVFQIYPRNPDNLFWIWKDKEYIVAAHPKR